MKYQFQHHTNRQLPMKELKGKDISLLECLELVSFKIQHTKTLSTALKVGTTHMDGAKIITLFSLAHTIRPRMHSTTFPMHTIIRQFLTHQIDTLRGQVAQLKGTATTTRAQPGFINCVVLALHDRYIGLQIQWHLLLWLVAFQ